MQKCYITSKVNIRLTNMFQESRVSRVDKSMASEPNCLGVKPGSDAGYLNELGKFISLCCRFPTYKVTKKKRISAVNGIDLKLNSVKPEKCLKYG